MPIWARRKDATHKAIVETFKALGWSVCDTSRAPYCPDLFVAKDGRTVAVEIKVPRGSRNEQQLQFYERWKGEYGLVVSARQVIEEYGV